ncbi:MAG TPA: amidohydrolase family protein [Gammaproteobacteria bacterium]|nr:Xaa-Pro dipeptidase [Gammaproteobacteria bacterium]HJL80261.1 amidohydrolase family protein [Gammaproteobacteria bacterium]HJM09561.1 amidohydrolase family protein [Gammaproteobacteria bacterium]HJN00079.1 amidohydrolase family protein [Gammaproteobacteria bacterium]|tara:strand:- start:9933 stop:11243 length:1311 start_codon:yes stop_codon:yes gene_type:complete
MKRNKHNYFSALLFILFASSVQSQNVTEVYCGKLLNTATGSWTKNALIKVDQASGKIRELGTYAKVSKALKKSSLDLSDQYCLPALIDMHTHLSEDVSGDLIEFYSISQEEQLKIGRENARITLMAGFTTVRDVGVYIAWTDKKLRDEIEEKKTPGPRMKVAGYYLTIPGGGGEVAVPGYKGDVPDHIRMGVARGADAFRERAKQAIEGGADHIKLIASGAVLAYGSLPGSPEMTPEEISAVVEEAKKTGTRVTAHAHGALSIKQAILSGVDSIEHASLIDDEGIELAKKNHVSLTMDVYNGDYINEMGLTDGMPEEFLQKNRETTEIQRLNFKKAHEAGVKIVFGTDAGVYPHGQNAKQFSYMTKYGMTNLEAIQAATVRAAEVLGMDQEIGRVKEGFFADIIAVSNNPLTDIRSLEDIQYVIKEGYLYKDRNKQ